MGTIMVDSEQLLQIAESLGKVAGSASAVGHKIGAVHTVLQTSDWLTNAFTKDLVNQVNQKKQTIKNHGESISKLQAELKNAIHSYVKTDSARQKTLGAGVEQAQNAVNNLELAANTLKSNEKWTGNSAAIVASVKTCISDIKDDYNAKGNTYKWTQFSKYSLKAAGSFVSMVKDACEIVTIAGAPVGIVSLIGDANSFGNAIVDAWLVHDELYDQVGQHDMLKEKLIDSGTEIGAYLGNEAVGETIGEVTYYGIDVVNLLDGSQKMLKNFGKLNTVATQTSRPSFVWGLTSWDDVLEADISFSLKPDYFVRKALSISPGSEINIMYETGKSVKKNLESAIELGNNLASINT